MTWQNHSWMSIWKKKITAYGKTCAQKYKAVSFTTAKTLKHFKRPSIGKWRDKR